MKVRKKLCLAASVKHVRDTFASFVFCSAWKLEDEDMMFASKETRREYRRIKDDASSSSSLASLLRRLLLRRESFCTCIIMILVFTSFILFLFQEVCVCS